MPIYHRMKTTWVGGNGASLSYESVQGGSVELNLSEPVDGGTASQLFGFALPAATLQSFLMGSSQAMTVHVNGADEVQTLTPTGTVDPADTMALIFGGQTATAISLDTATAAEVQTALESLSTILPGNVSVSGPAGGPWVVTFVRDLGVTDVGLISATIGTTTGAGLTVAVTTAGGVPLQTFALLAGVPIAWQSSWEAANPLAGNVTHFLVNVAGAGTTTFNVRAVYN